MGKIITFYTYKGGIGRTMTLANVALRLVQRHGLKVIVVDWDLEAPSLHQYFGVDAKPGVMSFLRDWKSPHEEPISIESFEREYLKEFRTCPSFGGQLKIMAAGGDPNDLDYLNALQKLNFDQYYVSEFSALDTLRDLLKQSADVILLDSRTGITDIGWICTAQLPDAIFMLTAANQQSWDGLRKAAENAHGFSDDARDNSEGQARKTIWVGVSRVPLVGELQLTDEWLVKQEEKFQSLAKERKLWEPCEHPDGLRTFLIPHHGRWTVGEKLLFPLEASPDDYLSRAYDRIAESLAVWYRREDMTIHFHESDEQFGNWFNEEYGRAVLRREAAYLSRLAYLKSTRLVAKEEVEAALSAIQTLDHAGGIAMGRRDRELLYLVIKLIESVARRHSGISGIADFGFGTSTIEDLRGVLAHLAEAIQEEKAREIERWRENSGVRGTEVVTMDQLVSFYLERTGLLGWKDIDALLKDGS